MDAAALEASLVEWVAERCHAERVDVAWLGVDPARLPAGGRAAWSGDPCRSHPTVALTWAVDGNSDVLSVRPGLSLWVVAPVATAAVAAGERVEVRRAPVLLDAVRGGAWTTGEPIALRPIREGEAVTWANARRAPDVEAGTAVTLRVRSGTLEVRAAGSLLDDAHLGGPVRVLNHATHTVVHGTLVAADLVNL